MVNVTKENFVEVKQIMEIRSCVPFCSNKQARVFLFRRRFFRCGSSCSTCLKYAQTVFSIAVNGFCLPLWLLLLLLALLLSSPGYDLICYGVSLSFCLLPTYHLPTNCTYIFVYVNSKAMISYIIYQTHPLLRLMKK
jgi:hypothetical protein